MMNEQKELVVGKDYLVALFGTGNAANGRAFIYRGGNSWEVVSNGQSKIVESAEMVAGAIKKINEPGIHMGM